LFAALALTLAAVGTAGGFAKLNVPERPTAAGEP
jgi:hypothetical protein